ncbi:Hypothetical protein R9X50_00621400 [Acrodontium crateriforme]|uniref:Anaphase-promoting complex subunit 4 n=1 Tax=Acrodontium crateriforme TaxID=150365 RepID=A0AAQ3M985_9PEZI|nr:Hypothetical protein R9X50_00621400 [Acrodontium crateriforme]
MLSDEVMAQGGAGLSLLFEKRLANAIQSHELVAYCDPHDLIALVPSDPCSEVVVYRLNGQVAFSIKRKNGFLPVEAAVTALKWKPNGAYLAVGWADGFYGMYSGENGRVLSSGSVRVGNSGQAWSLELGMLGVVDDADDDDEEEGGVVVCAFGWDTHQPDKGDAKKIGQLNTTSEEWYDGFDDGESVDSAVRMIKCNAQPTMKDLSRALTILDVTKVLPRLSAIPSHGLRAGEDGTRFASQAATDGIFETQKDETSGSIDVLLVCGSDGTVQVLLDESINIGTCNLDVRPLLLASHPRSSSHAILSQATNGDLQSSFVELPLDALSGPLLHVIATNTKRMQNILSYTTHTIRCIHHDLTTGLQFPSRLLKNMNEELSEKQEGDVVTNLFHLAMTGCFTPTMLEWLIDIVKETNHKRWDQAVNGMYTNMQNHIFINLLPALDRLSIAAITLRGHACFHKCSGQFDVPPDLFTRVLDGIDSIRLVAQKVSLLIATEQKQFRAFSKWVRVMIEIGVAGPGSKGATEVEERETPNLDFPLLLAYMEKTLMESPIIPYVEPLPALKASCASEEEFWDHEVPKSLGYDQTLSALEQTDEMPPKGVSRDDNLATNLPALTVYLFAAVRAAVESITTWQSRMLVPPTSAAIPCERDTRVAQLYMSSSQTAEGPPSKRTTNVLTLPSPQTLLAHTLRPKTSEKQILLTLSEDVELMDAKYHPYEPEAIIVLVRLQNNVSDIEYALQTLRVSPSPLSSKAPAKRAEELHAFRSGSTFSPERILIGGRKGRTVCVVLGNSGRQWQILDLRGRL